MVLRARINVIRCDDEVYVEAAEIKIHNVQRLRVETVYRRQTFYYLYFHDFMMLVCSL